jgi:uncharacterized protein
MGILTSEIKDFVKGNKLGFVATVCPDGTPNLSPKGTTTVWDDDHLVFADIHSPGTVSNLLNNPSIEINMVDIFTRKGFRFKGTAEVLSSGQRFTNILKFYEEAASTYTINNIVLITVERVLPLWSPAYDNGLSEEDVVKRWKEYWGKMH